MVKNKKAAMEMSVGTMVTIVLLMSVLILGIVLIKSIFSSAKGAIDLTDEQLKEELDKIFSEEQKLAIYPRTRYVGIKQGDLEGVGFGIKNLIEGSAATKKFHYKVEVSDPNLQKKCGVRVLEVESWITTGKEEGNIPIPPGDFSSQKVLFNIPLGSPLCTIRFRVNVDVDGTAYATNFFDVNIKAK